MCRPRREIFSGQVYEIVMRTRAGLPFVVTGYMKLLLESVVSRVQRDSKVTLCHQLWMANHPHIIVVAKDKRACTQFYGEVQKQLTEAIKRLCGLRHLTLWNRNATSVIPLVDVETVCYRIAYLYANPARAHLVEKIEDYPGVSTWGDYQKDLSSLEVRYEKECPWIRAPFIEALSSPSVSRAEDQRLCEVLQKNAKESHYLVAEPNAWMECFGVQTEIEVRELNEKVIQFHIGLEEEARKKRAKSNRRAKGKKKLLAEALDLTYIPQKPSRRIFVYSLDKQLRMFLIKQYEEFCRRCRECYEQWKLGNFSVKWPDGAFQPPRPHIVNNFAPQTSNIY